MKKRELKLIIFIIVGSVGFTLLEDPLEILIINFWNIDAEISELLASTFVRIILIGILFLFTIQLGLKRFIGFGRKVFIRNISIIYFPVFLIIAGTYINWGIYSEADDLHLLLIIFSVLSIGLVEELCFRGMILPLSTRVFENKKKSLYLGLILSSILFGIVHYTNYLNGLDFLALTSQVFYASAIGMLLGGFMLRTGNIFVPALLHASLNFLFGHGLMNAQNTNENLELISAEPSSEWLNISVSILILLVITAIGWNMIKRVDKEAVQKDLQSIKI